ncbi:expressed unknown protein [Seminavis robusta]|nr:expressed unknown protein [Seminavis robusta]|eukprot:Sro1290_g259740.1 n/a (264) ;mRNA; r:2983-3774
MTDDPLSQSDTLFPSIQDDEKENANIVHLGVADGSDQEDMRATAQEQHEEVTRLLYQTQDMAEKVASLAETSCTEEEEDEEGNETDHDDECTGPLLEVVEGWLNAPRGGIRRRRRKKLHSNIHNKSPSDQEVPSSSLLQLRWQDYAHLWFRRHRMSFETAIVRRCLVPVLPLPALLHLMNRPKLTRQLVWGTILLAMLGFPLILWLYFPQRVLAPVSVQPKLDLFLQHPYYTSELHYSLHAIRPLAGETTSTFFESDSDYDFL